MKVNNARRVRKIVNAVMYALIGVLILVVAVGLFARMSGKPLFLFGRTAVWVLTDSMEEEIPERSYILVRRADASEVNENDVITFYSDDPALRGNLNTHRVMKVVDGGASFITRGDHNLKDDDYPADGDKLFGIYERNMPLLTMIGRLFDTKAGTMIAIGGIVILCFVLYVPELVKEGKRLKAPSENEKDTSASEDSAEEK
jgi:signal peptidase I